MTDLIFLDLEDVMQLHDLAVERFGGLSGIRDENLLLSALARAVNKHAYADTGEVDRFDLAAAYAFGIAKNHPFNDANKHTAWTACLTFLRLNGTTVPEQPEAVAA